MISYRDKTFCNAPCATTDCPRMLTEAIRVDAERWWGTPDAPLAVSNFAVTCADFTREPQPKDTK